MGLDIGRSSFCRLLCHASDRSREENSSSCAVQVSLFSASVGAAVDHVLGQTVHAGPVRLDHLVAQRVGAGPVLVKADELHAPSLYDPFRAVVIERPSACGNDCWSSPVEMSKTDAVNARREGGPVVAR